MGLVPASLRGRLVLAFVVLGLTTWLVVGVALFVALRGLHADATTARLADVTVPLVARARADFAAEMGVPAVLADLRDQVVGTDVGIYLQLAGGRVVSVGGGPELPDGLVVDPLAPAGSIDHGTLRAADGQSYAWVASILRDRVRGTRALIAATPDRSGADALRDLLGTLPAVVAVTLLAGALVASWLGRSVTRPLGRLADATRGVPTRGGDQATPLPLEGPTEVRELTARFDAMRDQLREARRRETELLADLRHDLRTPATVIAGFAQALRDGTATGADADRAAAAIAAEAGRIAGLVEDLGAIERLGGTNPQLRPEPLDVDALIAETAARFAGAAAGGKIQLVVGANRGASDPHEGTWRHRQGAPRKPDAPSGPGAPAGPVLVADRRAVERILSNLVHNSLSALATASPRDDGDRAGPPGERGLDAPGSNAPASDTQGPDAAPSDARGHVWLDAHARPAGPGLAEGVVIVVTDDGPGFAPGVASRAFERFVRGDPSRSGGGSGLGLAIVRELVVAHGGSVHAENVAPRGARVSVTLPAVPLPGAPAPATRADHTER